MEHLTKQQIILLTLLVSFVTSIATGIVTVSLMDQAPTGFTQTINRVVERTIERSVPSADKTTSQNASAVVAKDPVSEAINKVSKSIVRIKPSGGNNESVTGLGLVVSKDGVILTDKAVVSSLGNLVAVFSDGSSSGQEFPIQVVQSQIDGDVVFAIVVMPADKKSSLIIPVSFVSDMKLGQTVFSLYGNTVDTLSQGVIVKTQDSAIANIQTSIDPSNSTIGSPLFTSSGEVMGFKTTSLIKNNSFYPLSNIRAMIPILSR